MLIRYIYEYNIESSRYFIRLEEDKVPASSLKYGIVFGTVNRQDGTVETYDIPLHLVIGYLQGDFMPMFPIAIPLSDSEVVVDLVSKGWVTKSFSPDIRADPLFFEDGFYYKANDLNLEFNESEEDRTIMETLLKKYGTLYLNYIASHRSDFPEVPDKWLVSQT